VSVAPIRVLLADDHTITRRGLRVMLESITGVDVVAEAADGEEAVLLSLELRPSMIFLDVRMPRLDGIEATRRVKAALPDSSVVILSAAEDEASILEAMRAGASAYLGKSCTLGDLETVIRSVEHDGVYMSARIASLVLASVSGNGRLNGHHARVRDGVGEVTEREHQVLRLVGEGLTSRTIASRLGITERTVDTHVGNLYRRLGVNNRVDAVMEAMRRGLVATPGPSA
jgi:DNA-binding NarL/FixJ family response regulator